MSQNMTGQIKKVNETGNYRRTKMKKKRDFFRNFGSKAAGLRNRGRSFLDILEEDCSCKEIFLRASKLDPNWDGNGISSSISWRDWCDQQEEYV